MRRPVGILGGMGPEATVALMQRVIAAVPAEDDADHVPLIVAQNPQVPSRIAHLIEGTGADPAPVLCRMAERLAAVGATALAMPCNTAHHYAPAIRAAVPLPFLDMVAGSVAALGPGSVALMASPAVRRVGVFDAGLAGREVVHPDGDAALALIRAVKREGATEANRAAFAALIPQADQVLVACTEFSLLAAPGPGVVDTLDVLTRLVVAFSCGDTDG